MLSRCAVAASSPGSVPYTWMYWDPRPDFATGLHAACHSLQCWLLNCCPAAVLPQRHCTGGRSMPLPSECRAAHAHRFCMAMRSHINAGDLPSLNMTQAALHMYHNTHAAPSSIRKHRLGGNISWRIHHTYLCDEICRAGITVMTSHLRASWWSPIRSSSTARKCGRPWAGSSFKSLCGSTCLDVNAYRAVIQRQSA